MTCIGPMNEGSSDAEHNGMPRTAQIKAALQMLDFMKTSSLRMIELACGVLQ